jgi:hypothetical protein
MFPAWHIMLTAIVTGVFTAAITRAVTARWRPHDGLSLGWVDVIGVGVAPAFGVLLWRLGGNVPALHNDPIPGISPADVLSAPLAYVAPSCYCRLRAVGASEQAAHLIAAPAVAALVALIVNIITI